MLPLHELRACALAVVKRHRRADPEDLGGPDESAVQMAEHVLEAFPADLLEPVNREWLPAVGFREIATDHFVRGTSPCQVEVWREGGRWRMNAYGAPLRRSSEARLRVDVWCLCVALDQDMSAPAMPATIEV